LKKEVCKKIVNGIVDFNNEEKDFLETLENKGIVKNIDGVYTFSKKYNIGTISFQKEQVVFQRLDNDKKILLQNEQLNGANDGDFVLASVIFNPRGKTKVKIKEILEHSYLKQLVYVKENKFFSLKNNMHIDYDKDTHKFNDLDLVLLDGEEITFIGNLEDAKLDDLVSLYLYKENYRLEEYEAKNIDRRISFENRVDLTHLDFCTIDPATAKDHDDAIYYDKDDQILYVAIADVSHYIKEGSYLDEQSKKRAFSAYFPNKVLPMLPFSLSSDLCSLKPNKLRYSFVCKMDIDVENLKVIKSEFLEAVIESKNNFSYEFIDEQIETNQLADSLNTLFSLTKKFRAKRLKNGYDFRTSEHRQLLDDNEEMVDIKEEHSTASHQLVEECMLLANQESAKQLEGRGIFRVHEEPDLKKIDKLLDDLSYLGIKAKKKKDIHSTILSIQQKAFNVGLENEVDKLIIESQQQARYSSIQAGHFGLGFANYSHFTSPIRRYSDLVLHRILKSKSIPDDIEVVCEQISNTEREITRMVWDLEDRKYARWAKKHLGESFDGFISENEKDVKVELTSGAVGLRLFVVNYKGEKLYNKVKVSIESADFVTKTIFGKIV
jgi:ribonuclease R